MYVDVEGNWGLYTMHHGLMQRTKKKNKAQNTSNEGRDNREKASLNCCER